MRSNRVLNVVNAHCEGEIGNVIIGGIGQVQGETMFDKKLWFEENYDQVRELMLFEPRAAVWHNVNAIVPSNSPEAAMGYIILETTEYPAMSGSNTICVATVLLETGILPMTEPVTELTLEAPVGLVRLRCECENGKVTKVTFTNQPAFCYARDTMVEVEGIGTVRVDVAFGGMTFAMVEAQDLGFSLSPGEARELCDVGERIKLATAEQVPVAYPGNPDMPGITNFEWMGPLRRDADGDLAAKCTVVVSPGRCDRSPCGTGTSARLALLHARGDIEVGESFTHESITGSTFSAQIEGTAKVGRYDAVIPQVGGQAWITGLSQMTLDPTDPYPHGFTLSDTWFGIEAGARG
ncbi:proline racemase family protein [Leucobacter sp. wl10]|uniref:proline racemase family protein n=1 Tax=Leucobacter sp. wl10 TaxID=2304677 RepID=UPI000E5C2A34|nr:proline racemase family protein [Leucobacter sp. wl10]RGE22032.1 hypothetical protein D1J51_05970 [Leucobacter sp. wl10]